MSKILTVSPDYYPSKGGVEKLIRDLNKFLSKKYDIEVFAGTRINTKYLKKYFCDEILISKNKTFKLFGLDFPASILSYYKLYNSIKKSDIVFIVDVKFFFFSTIFFSKLLKKKIILITNGLIFHNKRYFYFKKIFIKIYLYLSNKFVTKIIANGMTDYNYLLKRGIRSTLINNGVNLNNFKCDRHFEKNYFLYFGRLTTNKGLDNLINFLFLYKKQNPNFKMKILGNGKEEYIEFLKKKIYKMNLIDNIFFFGEYKQSDLIKELSKSEFVFNPSKFESFGISLIEALAVGCNVIANNIEQFKYIENKSNAFYLVDFKNEKSVLNALDEARNKYQNINIKAINLAKNYSIDLMHSNYLNIIDETYKK